MIEKKFKPTEIGMIPEDWTICGLGEVCSNYTGLTYHPEDVSQFGTLVLRSSNIKDNKLSLFDNVYVNMSIPYRALVKQNDILVCVRNGSKALIGKSALIDCKAVGSAFGAFMTVLRAQNIDYKYLFWAWQSNAIQQQIRDNLGATINQITNKDISSYHIALPNNAEQQRIASALTSVDNLLSSLDKLIAKKRAIKQGAMQQLLTGKNRLKGFTEPWDNVKIGNVCAVKRGVRVVRSQLSDNGLYPVYQNTNIPLGYFDKFNVDANTPFVIVGGSAGQVGFSKTKFWAADDCAYLSCGNSVSNLFIYYELLFQQNIILSKVRYGSVPRLDRTAIVNLEIGIPSFEEQCKIAEVLTSMDSEIAALEAKRKKYETVKQGMMQQLLTGKIRLIKIS